MKVKFTVRRRTRKFSRKGEIKLISPEDLFYRKFYKEGISKLIEEIDFKLSSSYATELFWSGKTVTFALEKKEHCLPIISFVLEKYKDKGWNIELVDYGGKHFLVTFGSDKF